MKNSLLFIFLWLPAIAFSQSNTFQSIDRDQVIAYEFRGEGGRNIEYCIKNEPNRIHNQILLTNQQVRKLEKILSSKSSYGGSSAACFDPHLALMYYRGQKITGSIDICLSCNTVEASVPIPPLSQYEYPNTGFSKQARREIHKFCENIGFTKFLKPLNSMFD